MADSVRMIYRYPVKGLSPERLARVGLAPGACLPEDRRFAIALPSAPFDPAQPAWLPKTNFVMLMRDAKLARLRTRFDAASGRLAIAQDGRVVLDAPIAEPQGRREASEFFTAFMDGDVPGPLRLLEAPGHSFADARRRPHAATDKYVSLINVASIRALEAALEAPVDPLRFRANFYFEGPGAWAELGWLGAELRTGGARLRVVSPISRCAATHVNPATAERDLDVVGTLRRAFGHVNLGIYAEVIEGGAVAEGDALTLLPSGG